MKIATVDSACSVLDEKFMPVNIISMAAIVVDQPYEKPIKIQTKGEEYLISDPNLLINELILCHGILAEEEIDYVHLDLTLGGINLLDLTTEDILFRIPMSETGRDVLRLILPELQKLATEIDEKYQIPVLAIGKRSGPVRLAELYAAAYGVKRAMEKVKESGETIYLGLPTGCKATINGDNVKVESKIPMEEEMEAEAPIVPGIQMESFLNPVVRRFQTIKLMPENGI